MVRFFFLIPLIPVSVRGICLGVEGRGGHFAYLNSLLGKLNHSRFRENKNKEQPVVNIFDLSCCVFFINPPARPPLRCPGAAAANDTLPGALVCHSPRRPCKLGEADPMAWHAGCAPRRETNKTIPVPSGWRFVSLFSRFNHTANVFCFTDLFVLHVCLFF